MSQYYSFYCIFDYTDVALVSIKIYSSEKSNDPKLLNGNLYINDISLNMFNI